MHSKDLLKITRRVKPRVGDLQFAASVTNAPRQQIEDAIQEHGFFETDLFRVEPVNRVEMWNSSDHPDDESKRKPR